MSKTTQDREDLTKLLNGSQADLKSKLSIDEPEKEFTKPNKKKVAAIKKAKKNEQFYAGIMIPQEIYVCCKSLEDALKSQGKYTQAIEFQIFNTAVQMYTYNRLVKNLVYEDNYVATRELTTTSEAYRRSLQYLGLTVDVKKGALDAKESTENNPLVKFIEKMNSSEENQQMILKKKKKSEEDK